MYIYIYIYIYMIEELSVPIWQPWCFHREHCCTYQYFDHLRAMFNRCPELAIGALIIDVTIGSRCPNQYSKRICPTSLSRLVLLI